VHANRGLIFWGVALITAGAVALAIQSEVIAGDSARQAWRLWPLVLIVIGLAVISARTPFALVATLVAGLAVGGLGGTLVAGWPDGFPIGCGGDVDSQATSDGEFTADAATVELDLDCGEMAVSTGPGTTWRVDARYASGAEPVIDTEAGRLGVQVESGGFFGFADARQDWDIVLPTDPELALDLSTNAASSTLDLDGATLSEASIDANAGEVRLGLDGAEVADLSIDANAGSIRITVDETTAVAGSVEMNAGSLELCVADGTNVAITVTDDNITFSHDLDESGLTREGGTWRSGDGAADVTFTIEGNAASFSYNPQGGCS
jgi:hypothetical protein